MQLVLVGNMRPPGTDFFFDFLTLLAKGVAKDKDRYGTTRVSRSKSAYISETGRAKGIRVTVRCGGESFV